MSSVRKPLPKISGLLVGGFIAAIACLAVFANLAEDVIEPGTISFDQTAGDLLRGVAAPWLTRGMIAVTELGSLYVLLPLFVIVVGYLWFRLHRFWEAMMFVISGIGSLALNVILKQLFQRSRPDLQHLVEAGGYSFPSGHAMVAAGSYGMLGYLIWYFLRKQGRPNWYVPILTVAWVLLIGVSRVYLGVHYASDVLAGFAAGGFWLLACIFALHLIRYYKS
ncbi:phosphatase PAP2 family protein [Effusibacillus dendaii]|uniref:Phosphatidylglycerophosphatase B n=1 Tax=Effusibacillus dendaii TaxID=2743772 RepID=A0A7I8DIL4_9BACL|nr:phosphatase PAP2 family protein [Effusibacillus dendaii]BCJ88500.1 phosphatidylglycerophosphatase B [Effusibacillus dendaii]